MGRGSVHHQVRHPEDQALEGLDLTKDLWVGQVSAHNQVLTMEGLGSSQDQQEDPRKGLNLAREEGFHRVGQADRPLEGLAHLNGQTKRAACHGARCLELLLMSSINKTTDPLDMANLS